MKSNIPRIGDRVLVTDGFSQRKGKVVDFNLEHHWYMVEFTANYVDWQTGKKATYLECFKYIPDEMMNAATRIDEQIFESVKGAYKRRKGV